MQIPPPFIQLVEKPVPEPERDASGAIIYPSTDHQPMVWSTRHYQWLTFLKDGLELCFENQKEVFVAGDLMWYPVEGRPDICVGPDIMVVFGPGKGDRDSYRQWEEGGVPPQVVIEILSHGNTAKEMVNKMKFYNHHGVKEYLIFDPDDMSLQAWCRGATGGLMEVDEAQGWRSPTLGITFWTAPGALHAILPDGSRMRTRAEDAAKAEMADLERERADLEKQRAEEERQRAEQERGRANRLAAKLKELGIDPDAI